MPDVTRSDSQRSDTSLRPRVSFNRDVHVKRIVPREGSRVAGAVSGDGSGVLVTSPVRKERKKKSKKELAEEAAQVINQVDKVNCVSKPRGVSPEKFYTLPNRRREKEKVSNYPSASLDRKWARRNSFELNNPQIPPKKPQRTFTSQYKNTSTLPKNSKNSIFDLFKTSPRKKSNLRRSVSDATNLKSKAFHKENINTSNSDKEIEESRISSSSGANKKQLSPIIEVTPREDYFASANGEIANNKDSDNDKKYRNNTNKKSVTQQLKEYIDEVDEALYRDNIDKNKVVIIDLDKAEKISSNQKKSRLRSSFNKIKSITSTNNKKSKTEKRIPTPPPLPPNQTSPKIKEVINSLENSNNSSSTMMHSSQRPADKLPLTKGRTVDRMVRRLNNDSCSPPPKPNVMVTPNISIQHNNNQPFSYTRGLSPEKYMSDENLTQRGIVYAQVVCNNDSKKQTVHTLYKKQPNSDSDEGLGNEEGSLLRNKYREHKSVTHFGDNLKESPILPKYRINHIYNGSYDEKFDTSLRGRADGMDAKRRESLSEQVDTELIDVSARRDLLESRINKKIDRNGALRFNQSPSPIQKKYYYEDHHVSSDYRSSPENKITSHHQKNFYKSTPDIYHNTSHHHQSSSYHDSLRRDRVVSQKVREDSRVKERYCNNESEDEGFASSLLIASERQHTEDNLKRVQRNKNKEYDDSGEDDYRNVENMEYKNEYVPRERSIDDGSHFDPRIDKEFASKERGTLKRTEKKPPKPEKKSGLEKVKQLFSRDSKKKKEKKGMVREESLRARYKEYKGSREDLDEPKKNKRNDIINDYDYSNRRRLSTPSPSPSPTREAPVESSGNWFKSLDRLSRKKHKQDEKPKEAKSPTPKNLRFFGDTDQDSSDGSRPYRARISHRDRIRSQSSRELHNISEEIHPSPLTKRTFNKSMVNISSKPPQSPRGNLRAPPRTADKNRRKKYEISSVESSTEGDSSQQSQRSVVYLHAATVGDIPGPAYLRNGRRASSREELQSSDSGRIIQPHVKTLSRSFSVLAPWKPRHAHEGNDIDYSNQRTGKYEKTNNSSKSSRKESSTLLKKKAQDTIRRSNNNNNINNNNNHHSSSTLSRSKNRSKENLSSAAIRGSSSTLYKKKEKLPRENSRYSRDDYKKIASKSQSVESLRSGHNNRYKSSSSRDISRSVSMPKDPEKSAGWFKMSKKSHHKSDYRL